MSPDVTAGAGTRAGGVGRGVDADAGVDASRAPRVFDVCGPLPELTTVLEASAGTGKTFTIAALATRYVAEGAAELSELMLVTFGRAATSELRDRVRERLVSAERALRDPAVRRSDDALLRHLADVDDAELDTRRRRLTRALADFDRATIATTHGFCQQMLATLGIAGDTDPDAVLLPDVADLRDEVVDDLYLQRYAVEREPMLSVGDARAVARAAVSDHDAELRPTDATGPAEHRHRFAADVRAEVVRRKRARRLIDYDDLLTLLRDALTHPQTGPAAVERVRSRYRVVMVDEFQDTDRVQWDILRTAFHGHRTLVLIGDPKQAIYAFRGADVVTYLAARRDAHDTATLGRNWRSDAAVLGGLHHVLGTTALGDPRIVVRPVDAQHTGRRHDGTAAVRLRQVTRAALGTPSGTPAVGDVRELVYADVAAQVVQQLRTERLRDRAPDEGTSGDGHPEVSASTAWRPLRPGDVAVLCRRNADALAVRDALTAAGVPAVVSGLSSVFRTAAAEQWLTLLVALDQPGHTGRGAAAALTPFVGWDARSLAEADDDARDRLAEKLRAWAHVLAERGVAALLEAATAGGLTQRLLGSPDGERLLTDVRHIGQVLHEAAVRQQLGAAALTEWLRARIAEADQDYTEERSRRLETDAEAVQVVTVHAAKGLEFPVVHVPFAWDRFTPKNPPILQYHEGDDRLLHVGGVGSPGYADALVRHQAEDVGEDLRLAYVALTRASSHVVLWWAPSRNSGGGALTRLLLGDRAEGGEPPPAVTVPRDAVVTERFSALAATSGGTLAHELVTERPLPTRWVAPEAARPELAVAHFARTLDAAWRRTSYSGLTAAAHHAYGAAPVVADEPEGAGIQDEPGAGVPARAGAPAGAGTRPPAGDAPSAPAERAATDDDDIAPGATRTTDGVLRALPSPMADLPGGTAFGTLVHEVLEHVDTAAVDLGAEVLRRCEETPLGRSLGVDAATLADRLMTVLDSPLGPVGGDRRLRDVDPRDRLPELEFEMPLAGGDTPSGPASTLRDVAALLRRHLPADDPFVSYPELLEHRDLAAEHLRGYLTGSIDAVLRLRDGAGGSAAQHVVVDYKTNRLAAPDEDLTLWHYRPAALAAAMMDAHYPLQLLLYSAALHRFLRWRLPGYDPDRHLGGGLYLFVRGMAGPDTPVVDGQPCGVMAWRPPTAVVLGLSALLEGRPR